jgi:hypothetical protein
LDQLFLTIKKPDPLPDSIDFALAQEIAVEIPSNDIGKVDIYIDDTIGIGLDLEDNVRRVQKAVPLIITSFARPLNKSESTPVPLIITSFARPLNKSELTPGMI